MYFHCIGQMYSKRSRKGTRHAEGKILNYFLFLQHFFPRNTAKYSYITYEYTVLYFSTICTTIAMQCDVVVAGTAVCNAYHMRISMSLWKLGVSTGDQLCTSILLCAYWPLCTMQCVSYSIEHPKGAWQHRPRPQQWPHSSLYGSLLLCYAFIDHELFSQIVVEFISRNK